MKKVKACIDCEYLSGRGCNYPRQPKTRCINYVTGRITYRNKWRLASTLRDDGMFISTIWNTCGKRAKWFKQKGEK